MSGSAFGIPEDFAREYEAEQAFNAKKAKMIIHHQGREFTWGTDDTALMAAMDHVFRRRLALGETVFLSSVAEEFTGRSYATLVMPPDTYLQFTYTEYDGDALTATTALVESEVEKFGGLVIGPGDKIVQQS